MRSGTARVAFDSELGDVESETFVEGARDGVAVDVKFEGLLVGGWVGADRKLTFARTTGGSHEEWLAVTPGVLAVDEGVGANFGIEDTQLIGRGNVLVREEVGEGDRGSLVSIGRVELVCQMRVIIITVTSV